MPRSRCRRSTALCTGPPAISNRQVMFEAPPSSGSTLPTRAVSKPGSVRNQRSTAAGAGTSVIRRILRGVIARRAPGVQIKCVDEHRFAEDHDLVASVARGDDDALGALYDRYHRQCFSFAMRILAAESDAEEAVQETYVRVWRNAASYDRTRAGVLGWMLSITRNLCLDELRRRRRRAPEFPGLDDAFERPGTDRTDLEAERTILGQQVRGALQSLSSEQRSAIELVYFHGLSSQEVGRLLNVPPPTVRSRLRLGLLKLGGIMQEKGLIAID